MCTGAELFSPDHPHAALQPAGKRGGRARRRRFSAPGAAAPRQQRCAQRPVPARKAGQVHECGAPRNTGYRQREAPVKDQEAPPGSGRAAWPRQLGPARKSPAGRAAPRRPPAPAAAGRPGLPPAAGRRWAPALARRAWCCSAPGPAAPSARCFRPPAAAGLRTAATASPAGPHGNSTAAIIRGPLADASRRGVPPRRPNSAGSHPPQGPSRRAAGRPGAAAARSRRCLRRSLLRSLRPARAPAGLAVAPAGCLQRVAALAL